MSFEFPLVFFTLLSKFGLGLAIFLCWHTLATPKAELNEHIRKKGWLWAGIISGAALIFSLFHLGHPFSAYKALFNLGDSWLSREAVLFALFCAMCFWCAWRPGRALCLMTTLIGCIGLIAQGITYAPPSMPSIHNIFPLATFTLSAIALDGCCAAMMEPEKYSIASRLGTLALIVTLLAGPALWISGSATMQATSQLWFGSALFWIGIVLLALGLIATWFFSKSAKLQLISLFCGLILTRMVFFADTVHTASHLGLPFN